MTPSFLMRRLHVFALALCFFVTGSESQELTVAVAANARYPFDEIRRSFETETGWTVHTVVSSSGNLTSQILNGAPFDLFLSADTSYPNTVQREGYAVDSPRIYAYGKLVLWMSSGNPDSTLQSLNSDSIHRIAMAEPTTAPYGREAEQALLRGDLFESLRTRIVYGVSISQVNQYILSNSVDAALTGQSLMLDPAVTVSGAWTYVDASLYSPIAQGMVVVRHSDAATMTRARRFAAYVLSAPARTVFQRYGYALP